MKISQALLALILTLAFALPALAQEMTSAERQTLDTLIEKARARESIFDGYDISGSAVVEGREAGTASFRTVFSGERFLVQASADISDNDRKESVSVKVASDGATIRLLEREDSDNPSGSVMKHTRENLRHLSDVPNVGSVGIAALMQRPGPLSMHLAADNDAFAAAFGESGRFQNSRLETTLKDPVTIDGRECIVVDCAIVRDSNNTAAEVNRLYFAPDLDYSCVKLEFGSVNADTGDLDSPVSFTMSDFREVKPGLLLPFTILGSERNNAFDITLDSVEFPSSFDDSLFTFDFPKGTRVRDQLLGTSYVVGDAAVPDPDSLIEEASSQDVEPLPDSPDALQEDTSVPPPEATNVPAPVGPAPAARSRVPSVPLLILLALAALCVVIGIVFIWRKRV